MTQLDVHQPSELPAGYQLRRRLEGSDARGFGRGVDDQVQLVYTKGWSVDDWNHPLIVHYGARGADPLVSTEGQPGQVLLDVGLPGGRAAYHDGLWAPGPGEEQRMIGQALVVHWDRTSAHSVTLETSSGLVAVRAPKSLTLEALVDVARSAVGS